MSKIKTIKIENFKAISEQEMDFKGCTAIITGGNNKGKTSFLKGLPDRIRFVRPEVMVKQGSTKGKGEMTLDTGERFIWEFNVDGQDKLTYITTEGAKRNVTVELGGKFFPKPFDIDKFLNSTPKEQSKQLQKVIGIDFTDIDARYATAYQLRTDKNKDAERYHVKLTEMMEVPKVDTIDLAKLQLHKENERAKLNAEYIENKSVNDIARKEWQAKCQNERIATDAYNKEQDLLSSKYNKIVDALAILIKEGYTGKEVEKWLHSLTKPDDEHKEYAIIPEPTYIDEMPDDTILKQIDKEIFEAVETNSKAQAYADFVNYKVSVQAAKVEAANADDAVKLIEEERRQILLNTKLPDGIAIVPDGLTYEGLPIDRTQLSSSRIAIAALKIGALGLGEVKAMFFDASYMDKNSLNDVCQWADAEGYQLLIERPDFEGGEITYNIIETA